MKPELKAIWDDYHDQHPEYYLNEILEVALIKFLSFDPKAYKKLVKAKLIKLDVQARLEGFMLPSQEVKTGE